MRPSAKKFLERSASLGLTPASLHTSWVMEVIGHLVDGVGVERPVGQRVGGVARLGQVALLEGVAVDDEHGPLGHQVDVGLERGGVHGHEHVGRVTRGEDVVVRDVDLEGGHPVDGAGRGPDLGREVGERGEVVAQEGAARGETVPRELHPVTGVAGEAHDDLVQLLRSVLRSRWHALPHLVVEDTEHHGRSAVGLGALPAVRRAALSVRILVAFILIPGLQVPPACLVRCRRNRSGLRERRQERARPAPPGVRRW